MTLEGEDILVFVHFCLPLCVKAILFQKPVLSFVFKESSCLCRVSHVLFLVLSFLFASFFLLVLVFVCGCLPMFLTLKKACVLTKSLGFVIGLSCLSYLLVSRFCLCPSRLAGVALCSWICFVLSLLSRLVLSFLSSLSCLV
jgi:hypothetical protein